MTPNSIHELDMIEDAALTSGGSFWSTKEGGRGRRALLTDGPHGVRYQAGQEDHMGLAASEPATCFPPAAGLGQSWDPDLVERVGAALAVEARHFGVGVLLGPGINIRRDPRGGRNFEYYSEDPHLSGVLGTSWVRGLQSGGVGASVKHFAANNCETDRMRSSSDIAPRPLREIYLRGFERVVKNASPWTVMCSYNKINGVLASQNRWLLTDVLRGEWGFDGAVVSDWGAVADRTAAVAAGLDLAMPGGDTAAADRTVADAARAGALDPEAVRGSAERVRTLIDRVAQGASGPATPLDLDAHHQLARTVAGHSIVLLKNEGDLLPLSETAQLAVIGPFAKDPRFQGGGSSHVNASRVDIPLDEIRRRNSNAVFTEGISLDAPDAALVEAVRAARNAAVAVLFLGLSEEAESEGVDRTHIDLPGDQLALLQAVVEVQPRTVVVLSHGGVVDLTAVAAVAPAILDGALLGQAGGGAIADVLFGDVNPSGRLTETIPVRLQDAPSFLNFPGEHSRVTYGEGLFVGYRGYDAREMPVAFPFGHGLSYTTFTYGNLTAQESQGDLLVSVQVTNSGARSGREVVQVYVGKVASAVQRAPRELKGFGSITLAPGETGTVTVRIDRSDLMYWEDRADSWALEDGDYTIWAAASSRDLRSQIDVTLASDSPRVPLDFSSTLGEILAHPIAGPAVATAMQARFAAAGGATDSIGSDMAAIANAIPLDRLNAMSGGGMAVDLAMFEQLFAAANGADSEDVAAASDEPDQPHPTHDFSGS